MSLLALSHSAKAPPSLPQWNGQTTVCSTICAWCLLQNWNKLINDTSKLQGPRHKADSNYILFYKYREATSPIPKKDWRKHILKSKHQEFENIEQRNIFLHIGHGKELCNVPMTFHQRLLQKWQNLCDISQLQSIPGIGLTPELSTFQMVKYSGPAVEFHGALSVQPLSQSIPPRPTLHREC